MAAETTRIPPVLRQTWISSTPLGLLTQRLTFTTGNVIDYNQDHFPIAHPVLKSTGGSPPFNPDSVTPFNTNEPYVEFLDYLLGSDDIPQVLTTSYGDDEQTVCRLSSN